MSEILEVRERPQLRHPVLLAGFEGWGNAGEAASSAVEFLLGEAWPAPCAVVDADACFDFTDRRPVTRRGTRGEWEIVFPKLAVYALPRPKATRDLLLILGPEPNLRWTAVSRELASFAKSCGVDLFLTLGGYIGPISHRRADVNCRTLQPSLEVALSQMGALDTSYEGPTAYQTALLHAANHLGLPAASLWVASPPYIQGPNPLAVLTLLETADRLAKLELDLTTVKARSKDWVSHLDAIIMSNPNLASKLDHLVDVGEVEPTEQTEASESRKEGMEGELPSGSALVEELERFLRDMRRPPEGEQNL
ncbi:MAG: PAC2 family protein [Chloroflexi bacterium]|nr:PAC2 family protein [Chloroflexota bacterium]